MTCPQETSELAESFRKSDQILASGNLQSIASLLGTMQRGLSVVGSVPEFRDGGARLQVQSHLCDISNIANFCDTCPEAFTCAGPAKSVLHIAGARTGSCYFSQERSALLFLLIKKELIFS